MKRTVRLYARLVWALLECPLGEQISSCFHKPQVRTKLGCGRVLPQPNNAARTQPRKRSVCLSQSESATSGRLLFTNPNKPPRKNAIFTAASHAHPPHYLPRCSRVRGGATIHVVNDCKPGGKNASVLCKIRSSEIALPASCSPSPTPKQKG